MTETWLIVANASRASIYTYRGKELHLVQELYHPESRAKGMDLVTDAPGHYHTPETSQGTFAEMTNPKEVAADGFALQLAKILEAGKANQQFAHVLVYASPHFHGLLNKHFHKELLKVSKHVQKDYTHLSKLELEKMLKEELLYLNRQWE